MAKLTLTDLTSLTNQASAISTINANNALIEALAELLVSRDGTAPNTMTADLDINSKKLLNVASGTAAADGVNYAQLTAATGQVPGNSMLWETATADSDQGAGKVWGNAATASITILYVDDADVPGADISTWVQTWDNSTNSNSRGYITIVQKADGDNYAIFEVDGAVTDASGYTKIPVNYIVGAGTLADADPVSMHFTRSGDRGSSGIQMLFETATTDTDQGAGKLWLDNGTLASATVLYMDDVDNAAGTSINSQVDSWDDSSTTALRGTITFKKVGTPSVFATYNVTGAVTSASTYSKIAVTHVTSSGSFSDGDTIDVQFVRTGNIGATGSTGSTGSTGATGNHAGVLMAWESTTTDTDQGAGKVWLNHGTAASATVLYMDDLEDGGASINSYVDSWDDISNATAKGRIMVSKNTAPENFHIFNVTGSVTSASTYSKVAVTHVVSSGTISDTDAVSVHFSFSGQDGAGDLTAANNLSDVDSASTSLSNLGGLANVVEDTTPQLGGFLDTNSKFISHSQGAAIASVAGDTDIWTNFDGNTVHITGTNAITDFGTPKSAGDSMWVIFDGAASVIDSATITVAGNTNYQAAENDLALVYALSTSTFLFMPFPNSGLSPVYDTDTAKTDVANTFSAAQSGSITALSDGANISVDLSANNHFSVTLGGNRTLDNPSNIVAGTSGSIFITQDGSGSRTLAYGGYYDFAAGAAPTLTTTAAAVDRIDYIARTATSLHCVFTGDLS
jgi:hypothetical protein